VVLLRERQRRGHGVHADALAQLRLADQAQPVEAVAVGGRQEVLGHDGGGGGGAAAAGGLVVGEGVGVDEVEEGLWIGMIRLVE
jgi:hypothetical protein